MRICDGCGVAADDQHLRERIQRLEWATRFRPPHIQALLLAAAPPARLEDYFYCPARDQALPSRPQSRFLEQLIGTGSPASNPGASDQAVLSELQRKGLFLAYVVECPVEDSGAVADSIAALSAALLNRIRFSYRPKYVVLLSEPLRRLAPLLQKAGWGDRLILDGGEPFRIATKDGSDFELEGSGERLAAALNGVV